MTLGVHALRVALCGGILLLIHLAHARFAAGERAQGLADVPLETLRQLFPTAAKLGEPEGHGGRIVLDEQGEPLGAVLQTFPEAQRFLGFSGPTNTLIGLDRQGRIVGLAILSSRDTHDHVELIKRNPRFLKALNGKPIEEVARANVDAVTGATLTSLALLQGLRERLGAQGGSLKFPDPPTLDDARKLFPQAGKIEQDGSAPELWHVSDEQGRWLGSLLSNSPAADEIVGFQGPTLALLGATPDGKLIGLILGKSYDNDPYVGYVRNDAWFRDVLNEHSLEELGKLTWDQAGIEGVSGATMTSQAVAQGLLAAAAKVASAHRTQTQEQTRLSALRFRTLTTLAILSIGLVMSCTPLRGHAWFRRIFQIILIVYLGLVNGDLLSLALFAGWAQSGIPWTNALGLVCLSFAAIVLPIATKQNVYCDHLCPHGAAQQLLPRRWKLKRHPGELVFMLKWIRPILLGLAVAATVRHWDLRLVDLEPFDAYSWRAAALPTICIAVVSLIASPFLPMGYCQYGCPTGAVLGYLRRHARSDRLTRADALACGLLALGLACLWR